jgi:hypothetical protein
MAGMDPWPGSVLVVAGGAALFAAGMPLRTRLSPPVVAGLAAVGGGLVAAGALLIQPRPAGVGDWLAAVLAAAVLAPLHVRALGGPFGPG